VRLPARLFLSGSLFLAAAGFVAVPRTAEAFCGFYVSGADTKLFNNATQVVLMREGTRTVLSMANNYEGPASNFAMVVPVPVVLQKDNVKTLPREIFAKVDQLDAPRLVEYWEQDPCGMGGLGLMGIGAGGGGKGGGPPTAKPAAARDLGVTIEAQFTVGEYEIVILSAKDAAGLDTWLKQEKYSIPDGSEPYFRPYVQAGSKFFVARVDISKVQKDSAGRTMLSPLRFHYDTDTFTLPVRLGLVNSKGTQDLIVHILAKGQRYEVANYPNATIPTNFDVSENARNDFGPFYAALFDKTLEKNPKAVITEYSWDAGTCDPCPGPALYGADLATLGADVLPTGSSGGGGGMGPAGGGAPLRSKPGAMFYGGFTITRLHARYTKDSLGEDLVFRAAPAIVGGRETRTMTDAGTEGELEHGATPTGGTNNFQGRYAIRHPWAGPIECKEPVRNRWGGPPVGWPASPDGMSGPQPKAAKDLAFVPRDKPLPQFVRSNIAELGIKGEGAPVSGVGPNGTTDAGAPMPSATTATAPTTTSSANPSDVPKSGCSGCSTTPSRWDGSALGFLVALTALWVRRRGQESKNRAIPENHTSFPQG
jgi:hypothetical protein